MLLHGELTRRILGCAFDVHAALGPGLLESAYRSCLLHEMALNGLDAIAETPIAVEYRGKRIETAYRADVIVEQRVLLELKAVERLMPIHEAQTLTYLRLSSLRIGLLINFNVVSLKNGIKRLAAPCRSTIEKQLTP